ncbi:hypothetical protein [Pontibacter sp. H249]|uniref:hypothetical protein n=1 Tax=Pontibacter sp. H249 TaxID=3133420 RepID=UPI0030C3D70C
MNSYTSSSKKLKMRIIGKCIIFCLGFLLIGTLIEKYIFSVAKKSTIGQSGKVAMIMNHTVDADMAIFGSSVALVHFNSNILEKTTKYSVYNLGMDGNALQQYAGLLEEFNTYSNAKVVVIAGTNSEFGNRNLLYEPQYYAPYISNSKIYKYFSFIDLRTSLLLRYLPFYSFTLFDSNYYKEIFSQDNLKGEILKGYFPKNQAWEEKETNFIIKDKIDSESIKKYTDIIEKINLKGRKVVLVLAPIYIKGQKQLVNLDQVREVYKDLAGANNIFLDFTKSNLCYKKELFYNNTHLNATGADLFSQEFSKKLVELGLFN